MSRFLASLFAISLPLLMACGGGGGGSSTPPGPSAAALDADPTATPLPDAAYFKVPSTPLGAILSGSGTNVTFSYWNPNASTITVNLYTAWSDPLSLPARTLPMTRGSGGVWNSATVALPTQNFYVYQVGSSYVLDPYAKSMAQWVHIPNGAFIAGDAIGKGAILDPAAMDPDGGWAFTAGANYFDGSKMKGTDGTTAAPYAYASNRDAIVYEAGIRDLTVDPNLGATFANGTTWGTYKGLVAMLPHIQKLGVTHVQLLCPLENYTYDQTKIRTRELTLSQTSGANYNWGYDPQNYFTPSGMYSANPLDAATRVNELKTLVNEIHKQGMGVILDVVFNHTANNNVLGDPGIQGYYYRGTSDNGAGSNDVNSQAKMVRKLIVDSIAHWVGEYRVDGFRFDLMGVLDTQTLKAAYGAATTLNPKVVFLGEGWNGYYSGPATDYNGDSTFGADQSHSTQFNLPSNPQNIGMFSDSYRNLFKNGYPSDGAPAFLSGTPQNPANLYSNAAGLPTNGFTPGSTNNVVSYLTCHDNLCLYDVLAMATNAVKVTGDADILKRAKMGYAVLLTSQGLAFIHAGDEMFRTKETTFGITSNTKSNATRTFVDNSYNASDAINMVKWANVYAGDPIAAGFTNYASGSNGYKLYAYTQGLIALRKSTNAFRLPDAPPSTNLASLPVNGVGSSTLAFGYKAASTDSTGTYYVFHNANAAGTATFTPGADLSSGATLLADGATAGTTAIASPTGVTVTTTTVTLQPLTSAIFRK